MMSDEQLAEFLSLGDRLAVVQLCNGLLKAGKYHDDDKPAKRQRQTLLEAIRKKFKNRNKPDTDCETQAVEKNRQMH